ncbi:uncharacterized protein Dvir_GJ26678 [Drosophila virilis]|uniref:TIR domain-containing protein n=1 Tax=Drosophila virilis TaxID=7244 RepID=A0A0Q9W853_DROVI|nr:uncharacterized protein Dvir_GJ26678 [Drosophila virilis]
MRFKIDCASMESRGLVPDLPIPIIGNASLYFNNKILTELPNSTLYGYADLRELHVANNRITNLTVAQLPPNLTYLDVSNNSLKTLDNQVLEFFSSRSGTIRLRLSGNSWICNCDAEPLKSVHKLLSRPEAKNRTSLTIDAFLAFSHKDLELVEEYIDKLEKGSREFKLCFYQRDWLIGESIPACILKSIEESKRIIILMTKNFKDSSWGRFEFRMAIQATSIDRYKRLILIVYPEVEDFNDLDSELKTYMKLNTYLRRDDPQFWRKLIYAMPHNHGNTGRTGQL